MILIEIIENYFGLCFGRIDKRAVVAQLRVRTGKYNIASIVTITKLVLVI